MLTINNIIKRFNFIPILSDVSLDVNKGEIIQISGNNGSGKWKSRYYKATKKCAFYSYSIQGMVRTEKQL